MILHDSDRRDPCPYSSCEGRIETDPFADKPRGAACTNGHDFDRREMQEIDLGIWREPRW